MLKSVKLHQSSVEITEYYTHGVWFYSRETRTWKFISYVVKKEALSGLCYGLINIENGWIQEFLWREVQCLFKNTGVYGLEI